MKRMGRVQVTEGFALRQIIDFVQVARLYQSDVMLTDDNYSTNGKGVLGLIPFFHQREKRESFLLIIDGTDSDVAFKQLAAFFEPVEASDWNAISWKSVKREVL
ncbi:HPr family phosphocarrier protein [Desmospora activa]|uniref:PTS HPr component family protein n=1 Tax=Desmospora activa DSM 45169 TaxID=1121389 RepID=A0A2T4ZAV9_9BACL|nr:HPr family phosphocarrier protein [Desmospora activa]PTM59015.1 PTS HPr component family protein [Desmospora activa DSM 45169]